MTSKKTVFQQTVKDIRRERKHKNCDSTVYRKKINEDFGGKLKVQPKLRSQRNY